MLSVNEIDVRYGSSRENVLHQVSIHVDEGEIVSIVGANGAGKSTLINTISGLVKHRGGSITFEGRPLESNPAAVVRAGIIQVPEGRHVFAPLTVRENLIMGGYAVDKVQAGRTVEEMYELFPILRQRMNQPAGTLSGGEQQMLAIARAMVSQPKLLLLDEPSLGIAPIVVKEIFHYLQEISRTRQIPLLIVEQNAKVALSISTRVYVLEIGKITMEGPTQVIESDPHVIEAYFGGHGSPKPIQQ